MKRRAMKREGRGFPVRRTERNELASTDREAKRQDHGLARWEIHQQLHEVEMRVHVMPAAAAGQAGKDGRGSTAARVAHE